MIVEVPEKKSLFYSLTHNTMKKLLFAIIFLGSCSSAPPPIVAGKDQCHECKMVIMDVRFASEIITKKGKAFKFDDVKCMIDYMHLGATEVNDIEHIYVLDYLDKSKFVRVEDAFFVSSNDFHSPMNGNTAAFSTEELAMENQKEKNGEVIKWESLYNKMK